MNDLTGEKFGYWTVLGFSHVAHKTCYYWQCQCRCGRIINVQATHLKGKAGSKQCRSCAKTKHGKSKSSAYRSRGCMIQRCHNPNYSEYYLYGGRGIKVCSQWRNSASVFLEDMGEKPKDYSIERRDVNGNYEPSNCYWASPTQQGRNKRNNLIFEYEGKRKNLSAWAEEFGLRPETLRRRIVVSMWPLEKALTHPLRKRQYDDQKEWRNVLD